MKYFKGRSREEGFVNYALYLLGEADESRFLSGIRGLNDISMVGWICGLKAAGGGGLTRRLAGSRCPWRH